MIVYLHGLASCSQSRKAGVLRAAFHDERFFAPDYPAHDSANAWHYLFDYVGDRLALWIESVMFVGSSTGGCYALALADAFGGGCILINLALRPSTQLQPFVGTNRNYCTSEPFAFTEAMLFSFKAIEERAAHAVKRPVLLLLSRDDPVIDPMLAYETFRETARMIVKSGGNDPHGFDDINDYTDEIRTFYLRNL